MSQPLCSPSFALCIWTWSRDVSTRPSLSFYSKTCVCLGWLFFFPAMQCISRNSCACSAFCWNPEVLRIASGYLCTAGGMSVMQKRCPCTPNGFFEDSCVHAFILTFTYFREVYRLCALQIWSSLRDLCTRDLHCSCPFAMPYSAYQAH